MSSLIKPLFRLMVVTFIFAMLMPVSTTRAGPDCSNPKFFEHPACSSGGTEGLDYKAGLTTGVFSFPAVDVTPSAKENDLIPDPGIAPLEFFRPGPDSNFGSPNTDPDCTADEDTQAACEAWDAVWKNCDIQEMKDGLIVPRFTVSADNLSFEAPGGGHVALGGIEVDDAPFSGMLFVGLHLVLIGDCFDGCTDTFVPSSAGGSKEIELKNFWLTEHTVARGKKGHCNKDGHIGPLVPTSTLRITVCPDGEDPPCPPPE
jgi:hypothetical protein